jgi:outer membrane protein TolC
VIDSLITRAVKSNLDLRVAEARVREARFQSGVVAADLWPSVNTSASILAQQPQYGYFHDSTKN